LNLEILQNICDFSEIKTYEFIINYKSLSY